MRPHILLSALTAAVLEATVAQSASLQVQTSSGLVQVLVNSTYPNVRQFLGVPFAQSPVGDLCWLPPQQINESTGKVINTTSLPPACPQMTGGMSLFSEYAPETLIAGGTSEDCLKLSIWTSNNSKTYLPVLVWIYGGEFTPGGTDTPAWIPTQWIERTQDHIVISIQYRLSIFGFPEAEGFTQQNLGTLDQRAAGEWIHDNIAAFGGDPEQIVLWGQSAGAASVDVLNFAYPEVPIVQGFVQDSGSVFLTIGTRSTGTSNFSSVAAGFNYSGSASDELACLRAIPATNITDYLPKMGVV